MQIKKVYFISNINDVNRILFRFILYVSINFMIHELEALLYIDIKIMTESFEYVLNVNFISNYCKFQKFHNVTMINKTKQSKAKT